MASRRGMGRATQHIQRRFLYIQDLASTGVVRMRKVPTKGNLADLDTRSLPLERLLDPCELHHMQSVTLYYNRHAFMQHNYHAQLAHHHSMNKIHI